MRTTIDIDDPILRDLKALGKKEGKSIGRLISDLLAQAIDQRKSSRRSVPPPAWIAKTMNARVNIADREALYEAMASSRGESEGSDPP